MSVALGEAPLPGLMLVMTSPEAVLVAPFSVAALSRKAWPTFFSPAAVAAARVFCSSWIFGPQVWRSTFGSLRRTPSASPALTISSSASVRLNGARLRLTASPIA